MAEDLDRFARHSPYSDPLAHTALLDDVAALLVRADTGDAGAEAELSARYQQDELLRPGDQVATSSPFGGPPRLTDLGDGARQGRHADDLAVDPQGGTPPGTFRCP